MLTTRRTQFLVGMVILFGILITYYGISQPDTKKRYQLQLKWVYNASFVGDLVAKEKDFWKNRGIDVEVRTGGAAINPIRNLLAGEVDFAVATGDQVLLAQEEGAPIVAIALIYRDNPLAWIVRTQDNINNVLDMRNHRIGVTFIDDGPLFEAMLKKVGMTLKDVIVVPVKFDPSPFLKKDVDAYPVFRNTQGIEIANAIAKSNNTVNFISPNDVGITSYSNLYVTLRSTVNNNPQAVAAFVKGALDGWIWAQKNVQAAATIVSHYDNENTLPIIIKSVEVTNSLVQGNESLRIGEMTLSDWNATKQVLLDAGQLKKNLPTEELFTTTFVARYYK